MELRIEDARCRAAIHRIAALAAGEGGRALLVGGCVRDTLLGRPIRDVDLEVLGVAQDRLEARIREHFACRVVGAAFPVLKLHGLGMDVAVPASPEIGFEDAAKRRDFTINAMGMDPGSGELLDPHGGRADLEQRILRHTSAQFAADPLRVLRGMQLVARFDLEPAVATLALCRTLSGEGLAPERVFEEWRKLVLRGQQIGNGLRFLQACDWLPHFPELEALVGCPQDAKWHPEGDVWVHTGHCMDAFAGERSGDDRQDLIVGFAVLCHDLGKPATTRQEEDGRISSRRHEPVGEQLTHGFLSRMTRDTDLLREVPALVAVHLAPSKLHQDRAGDAAIRRLARRIGSIERLIRVAAADFAGRPPLPAKPFAAGDWLRDRARALELLQSAPPRLLEGRHLIELGLAPGPHFGPLLDACYEAQLEGELSTVEQAKAWAESRIAASYREE